MILLHTNITCIPYEGFPRPNSCGGSLIGLIFPLVTDLISFIFFKWILCNSTSLLMQWKHTGSSYISGNSENGSNDFISGFCLLPEITAFA